MMHTFIPFFQQGIQKYISLDELREMKFFYRHINDILEFIVDNRDK